MTQNTSKQPLEPNAKSVHEAREVSGMRETQESLQPETACGAPSAHPFSASRTSAILSWVAVLCWAGFIFFMSSNTSDGLDGGLGLFSSFYQALKTVQHQLLGPDADALSSLGHFAEYAVLGGLLTNALRFQVPLRRAWLIALLCASLYDITDEVHQLFVPGRMCDPLDWIVDSAGALLGAALVRAFLKRRLKN